MTSGRKTHHLAMVGENRLETAFERILMVVGAGVDPATSRFSGARSTN
jgi:hypothetical protein